MDSWQPEEPDERVRIPVEPHGKLAHEISQVVTDYINNSYPELSEVIGENLEEGRLVQEIMIGLPEEPAGEINEVTIKVLDDEKRKEVKGILEDNYGP